MNSCYKKGKHEFILIEQNTYHIALLVFHFSIDAWAQGLCLAIPTWFVRVAVECLGFGSDKMEQLNGKGKNNITPQNNYFVLFQN